MCIPVPTQQRHTNCYICPKKCKDCVLLTRDSMNANGRKRVCKEHEEMFILLWLTNLSTKATNSSYSAPAVRCLPDIGIGFSLCVLVTHIPCVCMSTFPKALHLRARWKSFSPTASIYKDNSVSPHVSNAVNSHMAGFSKCKAAHLIVQQWRDETHVMNAGNHNYEVWMGSVGVLCHS